MNHFVKSLFAAGAVIGAALYADAGHDLPINGDFYGAPTRHHVVPGWSVATPGGVRLFPGRKPGKQILELISRRNPKVAVSELHAVTTGVLELDAEVSGRGTASLGFEAYDGSRRVLLQSGKQPWRLTDYPAEIKYNFPLTDPRIAFVRITLTAEPGSVARFADVDAEMKYAPAPAVVVPPPPPPAPAPAPAPVAPAAAALVNDAFYTLESLPPVSVFQTGVPIGRDIDFKLGEHPSRGQYWTVVGNYDPRVCRIEMEHKHKRGLSYAKIELNAVFRGTTNVEFVNPAGKRVIVQFTAL